jgi:hypothetical protein
MADNLIRATRFVSHFVSQFRIHVPLNY